MAEKNFGVKKLDIIGSGTPTIQSPGGGDLNITAATSTFSGNVTLPDNKKLRLGDTAGDFDIYYDNDAFLTTGSRGLGIQVYNGTFSVSSGASNTFKFGLTAFGFTSAVDLVASGSRNIGTNTIKWNDAHFSGTVNAGALDLNGGVLTLDADADTTITADTDDQIDIAFGGNDRITMSTGLISIKNDGSQSELRLYCESSNAHYLALRAPAHSAFSGNPTVTLPSSAGTLALTSSDITGNANTATKAYVTETNTDTATRGLVFCDAANNASGNKDLKYDRNLAYDPTGNRIIVDTFQGNTVNVGAITLGGSNGSSGQYVRSTGSGAEWANFPSGNIEPAIEVTQRTNDFTTNSTSYQTAVTTSIDPTASGSTLLIVAGGLMAGYRQDDHDDPTISVPIIQLYRGTTALGQEMKGTALPNNSSTGYYRIGFNLTFKDTNNHGGNSVTYYLKIKRDSNSDHENVAIFRATTLTVQEII